MINTPVINRENNKITINSKNQISTLDERKDYELVWGAVSAVIRIETEEGIVIPIVKRSDDAPDNPSKWALLPAGGIDNVDELRCPNFAMEREIWEEVRIYQDNEYYYPLLFSHENSEIEIFDEANEEKYHGYGEFFRWENMLFLISPTVVS